MKGPSKVGMKCGPILFGRMNIEVEFFRSWDLCVV